jgi:hypothetical protein
MLATPRVPRDDMAHVRVSPSVASRSTNKPSYVAREHGHRRRQRAQVSPRGVPAEDRAPRRLPHAQGGRLWAGVPGQPRRHARLRP